MAVDLMRSGPRGATPQASWMNPLVVTLNDGLVAVGSAGLPLNIDASGAAQTATWVPPQLGITYQLTAVSLFITELFADVGGDLNIGTSADGDAFVNDFNIPNTTAAGLTLPVPLNGAGAGRSDGVNAITALQHLVAVDAGGSGANGRYTIQCFLEPVGGPAPFFTS